MLLRDKIKKLRLKSPYLRGGGPGVRVDPNYRGWEGALDAVEKILDKACGECERPKLETYHLELLKDLIERHRSILHYEKDREENLTPVLLKKFKCSHEALVAIDKALEEEE